MKIYGEQTRINQYVEQKRLDEFNCKLQEKLKKKKQWEHRDRLAKKLFDGLPDIESAENKCYQVAVKDLATKWDEQENKRNEHIIRLRNERLVNHTNQMDAIEQIKQQLRQQHETDKTKRKINEKIDLIFYLQQQTDKVQKAKQLRQIINQQIESTKQAQRDQLISSRIQTNAVIESEAQRDDKHFFDYANRLVRAAKNKGIPLHPLKKVIDEYIMHNSLVPQDDDLPHMKSQIDVGISVERKYALKQSRGK